MSYQEWLEDLRNMAAIEGINLNEDEYHYHTYYMRGHSIEVVIEDLSK